MCQLGCAGIDPNPSAPGVYIDQMTPLFCFDGGGNDLDYDGVTDHCELWLALSFDPEMAFSHADYIGREPRWAARQAGPQSVLIAYLLSYYVDTGTDDPICENIFTQGWCRGHYGDSEDLYFTVTYNPTTQHWVLTSASLSQHGNYHTVSAGSKAYPYALQYPVHPGAYPRIWASYGKHANYTDANACDTGLPHLDACIGPFTYERLGSIGFGNLGSDSHRLQDCVVSGNPFYSTNPPECYWSGSRFNGWQYALPDADPYGPKLRSFGF